MIVGFRLFGLADLREFIISASVSSGGFEVLPWRRTRVPAQRRPRRGAARHLTELLSMDEPRKRFAGMVSGLDIHYDLGDGHPLLGRRMPAPGPCC